MEAVKIKVCGTEEISSGTLFYRDPSRGTAPLCIMGIEKGRNEEEIKCIIPLQYSDSPEQERCLVYESSFRGTAVPLEDAEAIIDESSIVDSYSHNGNTALIFVDTEACYVPLVSERFGGSRGGYVQLDTGDISYQLTRPYAGFSRWQIRRKSEPDAIVAEFGSFKPAEGGVE